MAQLCAIKLNKEFRAAYYHGKVIVHPLFIAYVRKTRFRTVRIGITTGKKIGKAVQRNRCRRVIREACRQVLPQLKTGRDYVFVARKATLYAKSNEVLSAVRERFGKEGLLS